MKSRWTRVLVLTAVIAASFAAAAAAIAPSVSGVTVTARRPAASFTAPRADYATVYIATRPDRATDGSFFSENIADLSSLTADELQSGYWSSSRKLDPGAYWLLVQASPNFASCYLTGTGGFDPACADGYSQPVAFTVPRPLVRWSTSAWVFRFLEEVDLRLTATPFGARTGYRVCWRNVRGLRKCVNGVIAGYSWDASSSDIVEVRTRNLPKVTTFTWFVKGVKVATRRVRIR